MAALNQFAISKALDSTMSIGETPRFGRLGLLPLVGKACRPIAPAVTPGSLDDRFDSEIVRAFKQVSEERMGRGRIIGRDRLLADPQLARAFVRRAKDLGVDAAPALINRRLMRIGKKGGVLPKTTVKEPLSSIDPHNIFAIEYGIVRIAHLYGATVDDILCEPSLAKEYHKIVETLAPGYTALVYRLGALYLRKTRNLQDSKKNAIERLDPSEIESSWLDLGSIMHVKETSLKKVGPGILDLDEGQRSLYISKAESVAELASTFLQRQLWETISNHFWQPDMGRIHIKVLPQSQLQDQVANWELRLIQFFEPVFNMKVAA